ncbi:ubiquitin carboxyl-terminal hydrolase 50-like [Tautogolabrus adspersus]
MTKDFREALERYTCDNPSTECIDHQLKTLFDTLNEETATTYGITEKLGITRVYDQQDAAEYFEKILNLTSAEASQVFHGMLTQRMTCSACDTQTETDGPFWHLPLALVDSYRSEYCVNGIEQFFTALKLSGDNQLYCDQCDDKCDATIKSVMKHHPEVLMLLLKKFEFDYYTMTYIKMNHTVHVPYMLQIPENQKYELYAFVEHFGDLKSGHYTATIKSKTDDAQKDTWYNFNDTEVTLVGSPFQSEGVQRLVLVADDFFNHSPAKSLLTYQIIVFNYN